MENKLWAAAALCALLLISSASVESENLTAAATAAVTEAGPGTEAAPTVTLTIQGYIPDHNSSLNGTGSFDSDTTTNPEVITVKATAEKSANQTNQPPSRPTSSTSVDLPSVSPTDVSTTIAGPAHAHTASVTLSPDYNASHSPTPALPDSLSTPLDEINSTSSTLVPTSESPVPEHPSVASSARPTSTSSSASSQQPQRTPSPTYTSSSGTITKAQSTTPTPTTTPTTPITTTKSSHTSSAQTKTHTDSSSQLNTRNDPTMVHDSPTIDPLLAGLVSAFIITAVIITLLLFLKLRRRDNRPEFRRLQDLPMDDMMEDTPLSMYSY